MDQRKSKDLHKELDVALGELEERVDRLRALYEQYFMGYEKLEPSVPRRDVDRRFTLLRKTEIRNTAQRYRFNVVTQKFNTYAMYWTRVCRQIEEGTFKRHLVKAAKRFGGVPTKREVDTSIDVELGDFELGDDDMAAILAEADTAAAAYIRGGLSADTVPPGTDTNAPSQPQRDPASQQAPLFGAPTMAFGTVQRGTVGSYPNSEATPPPGVAPRAARHAVVPVGTKPRVLLRRRDGDPPPPSTPPSADPSSAGVGPPSTSVVRAAPPPSNPREAIPPSTRIPVGAPPAGPSAGHVPVAPPAGSSARAEPSAGRIPIAATAEPSAGRIPVVAPSAATPAEPSAGRIPAAPDDSRDVARATSRANDGTARHRVTIVKRAGAEIPASPIPVQRAPASATGLPNTAPYRPIAPPSQRSLVGAPASTRTPAAPEATQSKKSEPPREPEPRRSRSQRPPPPLPSQSKKKNS